MKISAILDRMDIGYTALPEFQRKQASSRDRVGGFFGISL